MLTALILGTVVGFVLAIAPGPIAIAVIKNALQGKIRAGYQIAIGAAFMDTLFATVAAFASSAIVVTLIEIVERLGWLKLLLQVGCIIILVTLGYSYFKATTKSLAESSSKEEQQEARARRMGLSSPVFIGILLAAMNLATPTFLPSLVAVISYLHTNSFTGKMLGLDVSDNLFLAIGFGLGVMLWFLLILRLLTLYRSRLPSNFIAHIYRFAGGAFFIFAAVLAYNVIVSTAWSRLW